MRLPYYLGCPSWSENAWRDYLYPADARASDYLALYSQVFNAVEGNTTFYARPSAATVQRWAEIMPGFQNCQIADEDNSHWVLKVGVGGLVRTVKVDVHVDRWAGPEEVDFTFKLQGDPVNLLGRPHL